MGLAVLAQHFTLRNDIRCATMMGMATLQDRVTQAKLRRLAEALGGQSEIARILRVDRSRITRWLRGEEPDPRNQAKLDALEFVVARLLQHFRPESARKWLTGVNAHLSDQRPVDLIARNRIAEVLAAIEQAELDSYA
jgi:transcriptional regulator with XRE-family HTH domain